MLNPIKIAKAIKCILTDYGEILDLSLTKKTTMESLECKLSISFV